MTADTRWHLSARWDREMFGKSVPRLSSLASTGPCLAMVLPGGVRRDAAAVAGAVATTSRPAFKPVPERGSAARPCDFGSDDGLLGDLHDALRDGRQCGAGQECPAPQDAPDPAVGSRLGWVLTHEVLEDLAVLPPGEGPPPRDLKVEVIERLPGRQGLVVVKLQERLVCLQQCAGEGEQRDEELIHARQATGGLQLRSDDFLEHAAPLVDGGDKLDDVRSAVVSAGVLHELALVTTGAPGAAEDGPSGVARAVVAVVLTQEPRAKVAGEQLTDVLTHAVRLPRTSPAPQRNAEIASCSSQVVRRVGRQRVARCAAPDALRWRPGARSPGHPQRRDPQTAEGLVAIAKRGVRLAHRVFSNQPGGGDAIRPAAHSRTVRLAGAR